jgi:hypothetical protein
MDSEQSSFSIIIAKILMFGIFASAALFCWFWLAVTLTDTRAGASPPAHPMPVIERLQRGLPIGITGIVFTLLAVGILLWPHRAKCPPDAP